MADPMSDILGDRAAFAAQFQGTTNLAQRRRYQEDIQAAKDYDAESQERQFDRALSGARLRDPLKAEGLRIQENRDRRSAYNADRGFELRESAAERQQQQFEIRQQMQEEAFRLRERQIQIAEKRELRSIRDAARIEEQTEDLEEFEFQVRESGIFPGTKEYAQLIGERVIRNPYAKPDLKKSILQQARIDADPDEFFAQIEEGKRAGLFQNPRFSATMNADGKLAYRVLDGPEPKTTDPKQDLWAEHDRLEKRYNKAGDPEMKKLVEQELIAVRQKLNPPPEQQAPVEAPPAAPLAATPTTEASKPVIIMKQIDGKWVPSK